MKICLVVLFNHRYEKNIPRLREMYQGRFSAIRFIVPFYQGEEADVISVYESSYQFQGYVAQAYQELKTVDCDSYFFIADDMMLNPTVNEQSMADLFREDTNYSCGFRAFTMMNGWSYGRIYDAIKCFEQVHTNYQAELLEPQEAFAYAKKMGYEDFEIRKYTFYRRKGLPMPERLRAFFLMVLFWIKKKKDIPYPLMGGYSDVFIIQKAELKKLCHKFGVTAAMGLFVEIAVPTCLFLYSSKLETFSSLGLNMRVVWGEDIEKLEKQFDFRLNDLLADLEEKQEYLCHPVKLSKWK